MESSSATDAALRTRTRQQEVVADLGARALETDDLEGLFRDASAAVAETLGAECCGVFERLPRGEGAARRAGAGRGVELEEAATIADGGDSPTGRALRAEEPVVTGDLRTDGRFDADLAPTDRAVSSYAGARVGPVDEPWGVLEAYATDRGAFTGADATFLRGVANALASAVERERTRRELETAERRFEAVFEDPNILVGLLEPDGTVLDINETAMAYVDADLADVTGEPFWETPWWGVDETVRADVREWTERAADGEYVEFEADLVRPHGERYTLDGYFRPVTDDDGDVVSVIVSDRDVTERKERERQLEESERRYRTLVEHFPNGAVALVDDGLRYRTVGGSPTDVAGATVEEIEGKPVREAVPSALADELEPRYEAALAGEPGEFEIELADGIYQFQVVPVRDDDGEVFAAMGMSQEITGRVDAQRKLEESERRYRALAEHFPNGLVTLFDEDLEYTLAAGRGFDRISVEPDDLEEASVRDVWDEETVETLEPALEAAIAGEKRSIELAYEDRDWIVHAAPITDERGEVFAGMTMAQDVTEQKERERYLRDAKSQLEAATEAGAVGTWEWDVESDEFVAGASFAETFGVDPEAAREGVPLERMVESIHEADRDRVEAAIEETMDACDEYEQEYRVRNADGELRWVVARGRVECDDDGDPIRFPGALTDITERKRAELQLKRNNEQLETLFEILPVGVVVADADGRLLEANDTAREIWGGDVFDADSVAEYDRFPAVWADSGEPVGPGEWTLARVLDGEEVTEPDLFEIEAADGQRRIVRTDGKAVRNADGEVTRGVITITDVTERREYERKLEESERRYRTLVEHFPEGAVALFDEDLEYTAVGGQLLDEVGVPTATRVGNSVYEVYPDHLVEEVEPYFHAALEGEANSFEVEFHGRHLHAYTLPVRNAADEIFAGMLVVQNVTERREYERKLEQSNERLEQFAYAASHDLQEPLRMVSSYLQLIERRYADDLDEDGREFISFAVDGAERMRRMIDGLLEYSRVDSRGDPFEPVDLEAALEDVRADLRMKIEETDADVTVDSLPRVEGDPGQLRQLFQNLLDNAIEYSGDEPPRVHVDAERDGDRWRVSVRDEGVGIDPDDADRVFEMFQSLHSLDEHAGTGIGLALCERIVDRHGGDIRVDSEPDEGATFSFTLPAVASDE